ncbi:MAG: amino acid permease [Thermoplasmatota archaeon]
MAEESAESAPSHEASAGATPDPEEVKLARELTMMDATMLGVGALMGGGIFVLLGLAAGVAGPALILALFLNGLVTIPTLMVYAELGSATHDAGGGYLWVKEAMHQPFGFMGGWMSWFSHAVACALYSIASAAFVLFITNGAGWTHVTDAGLTLKLLAVGIALFFLFLNYIGVKVSIKSENAINTFVLVAVIVFIIAGVFAVFRRLPLVHANFVPFFPTANLGAGFSGVFLAMGITFIAFEGYEIISQASEEMKDPKRNIPRAIWTSLLIVWSIMLLVTLIAVGATRVPPDLAAKYGWTQSWQFLGNAKQDALAEAAQQVMPYGAVVIVACALLLQLTALNATIYSSSRVSFAMGRDGNLPAFFGKVHPKRRTPHLAVWGSGAIICLMALLPIEAVATSADIMFLLLFLLVNMSYIKLRNTIPAENFGYRAPLFPIVPLVGIATKFFLAVYLYKYSHIAWYAALTWLGVGLIFFYTWVKPREKLKRDAETKKSVAHEKTAPTRKNYRIVVPVVNPQTAESLARIATRVAQALDGEIHFLYVVKVPDVTPLAEGRRFVNEAFPVLRAAEGAVEGRVPVHTLVRIGHSVPAVIHDVAEEKGASLLMLGWSGTGKIHDWLLGATIEPLIEFPPCDLALVKLKGDGRNLARVLIPTHGGQHAALGVKIGSAIAKSTLGQALLYNVAPPSEETTMEARRARGLALITQNAVPGAFVELRIERSDDAVRSVIERAKWAEIVIVGATTEPAWRNYLFGHKTEQIADTVPGSVILVKAHPGPTAHRARYFSRKLRSIGRYILPR